MPPSRLEEFLLLLPTGTLTELRLTGARRYGVERFSCTSSDVGAGLSVLHELSPLPHPPHPAPFGASVFFTV